VRGAKVARGEPRALNGDEYGRLLRMPDLRTIAGKRDLALLHLLGTAGLRRAEACALLIAEVDERTRSDEPRLPRDQGLDGLVGDRALRQARQTAATSHSNTTHSTPSPPGFAPAPPVRTSSCSSRYRAAASTAR
jgi:integrase